MTKDEAMRAFSNKMTELFGDSYALYWEMDKKGVVCGWCKLFNAGDICRAAEAVAGFKGRVMTISPMVSAAKEKSEHVEINYHFCFEGLNCTVGITLPNELKKVNSITPILKSADWHEREMQELYNIEVQGHPNPKKLFLDESIHMTDQTMIPLSEAMNGAGTNTLWERIMKSKSRGEKTDE